MKLISNTINLIIILLPLILSATAIVNKSILLAIASTLSLFIIVLSTPLMKGRENFWMFIISALALIPPNVKAMLIIYYNLGVHIPFILRILISFVLYILLFQIEEIILGVIIKILRPNQLTFD